MNNFIAKIKSFHLNQTKLLRQIVVQICVCFFVAFFSVNAFADDFIVDADTLNIRQDASFTGTVVGKLKRDDIVDVIDIKGGWATIRYNGENHYVSEAYLIKSQNQQKKPVKTPPSGWESFACIALALFLFLMIINIFLNMLDFLFQNKANLNNKFTQGKYTGLYLSKDGFKIYHPLSKWRYIQIHKSLQNKVHSFDRVEKDIVNNVLFYKISIVWLDKTKSFLTVNEKTYEKLKKLKFVVTNSDKLDIEIAKVIKQHLHILAEKRAELIYQDDYGNNVFADWHKELTHFVNSTLLLNVDEVLLHKVYNLYSRVQFLKLVAVTDEILVDMIKEQKNKIVA